MANESEDFIKQHMFGNPQLKPDEKRAFLGNFRERVAIALTISQLNSVQTQKMVIQIFDQYPEYRVYLNGKMPQQYIDTYMTLAIRHNYQFTILVQNGMRVDQPIHASDFGLVIASPNQKIKRRIIF